jgi:hypothetical protein
MKLRRTIAAMATAGAIAVPSFPTAVSAQPASGLTAVAATSCSGGYKSAKINGVHKCLRAGEFCTHAYDHRTPTPYPYSRYGYRCIKFYSNVDRYRLTYA